MVSKVIPGVCAIYLVLLQVIQFYYRFKWDFLPAIFFNLIILSVDLAVANAIYSAKPNAPKFILAQIVVHIIGYVFTIILFVLFLNSVFYAKVRFSSYEADAALKAATSETYLLTFIPLPVDVLLMLPIVIYRRAVVRANLNTVKNVEN